MSFKHAGIKIFVMIPFVLSLGACTGTAMKPFYPKSFVQPVVVKKPSDNEISIEYLVPPESMYYASGVNYEISGDTLRVVIDRCSINEKCDTMIKRATPLGKGRMTEVRLPYSGQKVVMSYSDVEEQIYP